MKLLFLQYGSLGDILIVAGIIVKYSELYDEIIFPISKNYQESVSSVVFPGNVKKVFLDLSMNYTNDLIKIKQELAAKNILSQNEKYDTINLLFGFETEKPIVNSPTKCKENIVDTWKNTFLEFDKIKYNNCDVDIHYKWKNFKYTRNIVKETELKNKYKIDFTKPYAFVHLSSSIKKHFLYNLPEMQIIEPNRNFTNNIFDYLGIIENANQVHCIDSSYLNLVDLTGLNKKLYFHKYARTISNQELRLNERNPILRNWWNIITFGKELSLVKKHYFNIFGKQYQNVKDDLCNNVINLFIKKQIDEQKLKQRFDQIKTVFDKVVRFYNSYLEREPDNGGFNCYFTKLLNNEINETTMHNIFSNSEEYNSIMNNKININKPFVTLLHRNPTSTELNIFKNSKQRSIYDYIVATDEYTNMQNLKKTYNCILGRDPNTTEITNRVTLDKEQNIIKDKIIKYATIEAFGNMDNLTGQDITKYAVDYNSDYKKYIDHLKANKLYKKIHLITQYYEPKDIARKQETAYCFQNNLNNSDINVIHVLSEQKYDFNSFQNNEKIIQTITGKRLTFYDAMVYVNEKVNSGDICVFQNLDIYYDNTLKYLKLIDLKNTVIALSRRDINSISGYPNTLELLQSGNKKFSQDSWVVQSPVKVTNDLKFFFGVPNCDQRWIYIMYSLGYYICNPCLDIMVYHYHTSQERNYLDNVKGTTMHAEFCSYYTNNYILDAYDKLLHRKPTPDEYLNTMECIGSNNLCYLDIEKTVSLVHSLTDKIINNNKNLYYNYCSLETNVDNLLKPTELSTKQKEMVKKDILCYYTLAVNKIIAWKKIVKNADRLLEFDDLTKTRINRVFLEKNYREIELEYLNGIKHNLQSKKLALNDENISKLIVNQEFVDRTNDFINDMKNRKITNASNDNIIYTSNYYARFSIHDARYTIQ